MTVLTLDSIELRRVVIALRLRGRELTALGDEQLFGGDASGWLREGGACSALADKLATGLDGDSVLEVRS